MASVAMPSAVSKPKVMSVIDIVVDGLGQGDDVEPILGQAIGVLLGAAAAQADQRVQVVFFVGVDHDTGHVHGLVAHRHLVRFVAAGTENRAADRQDAG